MHKNLVKRAVAICLLIASAALAAKAAAPPAPQGAITVKEFLNITGTTIPNLTNNAKFPDNPDIVAYSQWFEWPAGPDIDTPPQGDVKNNYGVQIQGYFYPETTGPHTFYIAADDNARLYLSTDSNPANKKLIAIEPAWNPVRDFLGTSRRNADFPENSSATYQQTEWPSGNTINLTAGQAYYIEALMKEGGGGDNVAVSLDGFLPIPGNRLATIDKTTGPVSIQTAPVAQTVDEGTPVTFSVEAQGTPPYTFQWKKNGTDIEGATSSTFSIPFASGADNNAQFTVTVTGAQGSPVTSAPAVLTVTPDTTPPSVVSASGGGDFRTVTVNFSERVDATSAGQASNYSISGGVNVTGATVIDDDTVVLNTSQQTGGQTLTLTVTNVKDRAAAPNTVAANTTAQFQTAVFTMGLTQWQRWQDQDGDTGNIDTFFDNLQDPNFRPPTATGTMPYLGAPRGAADNYGARAFAWFKPPQTGNYVFAFATDDQGYLFLSTDDNPANKKKIAAQPSWANQNEWNDPDTDENQSDLYSAADANPLEPWPTFNTITLNANNTYYIEVIFREGGGGDGAEVTYWLESESMPANGTAPKSAGFGIFVDPSTLPPVITKRPTGTEFNRGDTVTLSVEVQSAKQPVTYQWFKSKQPVPNSNTATLTFPNAGPEVVGDYYVEVTNPNGTASSFPDNDARVIMNGAFVIEAEDYNFEGGKHVPAASTMPYKGGAYQGLAATFDIDLGEGPDQSGGAADAYGRNAAGDPEVYEETKGPEGDLDRGSFNVDVSYALGWTASGSWLNYTRNFPPGVYNVVAGMAHDGRAPGVLNMKLSKVDRPTVADNSTIEGNAVTSGGAQGVTDIGSFISAGTGGWSNNDLVPLLNSQGGMAEVELDGEDTLRLTFAKNDGDVDYFLLYKVRDIGAVTPSIGISKSGAGVTITYDGTLEETSELGGAWTPVAGAPSGPNSTFTVTPTSGSKFYRAK